MNIAADHIIVSVGDTDFRSLLKVADISALFFTLAFTELLAIYKAAIDDQVFGLYTFKIELQLFGMATISARMNISNNNYINFFQLTF